MSYQDEQAEGSQDGGQDGGQSGDASKRGGHGGAVALGRSDSFSFEEALQDAIRNIEPLPGADRQDTVRVEDIFAEFGGIRGRSALIVKIRRVPHLPNIPG
ncbi:MAG TPA: hypothetical protein VF826_04995 [Chloroflexia bacterium]|jgi:hypothetical protein